MSGFNESDICRSILESLLTGMCVVDMDKKIVFWSDGAERLTGHLRHEVIGRSCIAEPLLHCDQPGCEFCSEECPLGCAIKTSQPVETSGFLHHKSGFEVPVRIRAVPVHNQHGSIIGAVETFEHVEQANASPATERLSGSVDEPTGVATQALMQSHLRDALATFNEMLLPFGVLFFRVEGLEHFRAAFGPEAASTLLRAFSRTLEGALWRTDSVGRWADDQFLVLLNGCREDALHSVRERLRRMLSNVSIEWWGERRFLPVYAGQATVHSGDSVDSLVGRAQASLNATSDWRSLAATSGDHPCSGS